MAPDSLAGRTTLRPITPTDMEFLFRVYASTRMEELAQVAWSDKERTAFLRQQFAAQHAWWQEHYTGATFDVVLLDGAPAGRLYVDRWPEEVRIVDIALLPEHRGSGMGSFLIGRVIDEADAAGKPVSIHVERFNRARRLYDRLGFVEVGEHGVYHLMRRPVTDAAVAAQVKTAS